MNKKAVDLFCGAGGLSYGFKMAGFEILAGIDSEEKFLRSYSSAHPSSLTIKAELPEKSALDLLEENGLFKKEIDLLLGGPPCQGFSTVGDRTIKDSRNNLVRVFANTVEDLEPIVFVMENVIGFKSMENRRGEKYITEVRSLFEKIGYRTKADILTATDYGVPQKRKRFFLVGIQRNSNLIFSWPKKTHFPPESLPVQTSDKRKYLTVGDAISDLPSLVPSEEKTKYKKEPQNHYQKWIRKDSNKVQNHSAPNHTDLVLERLRNIPPSGNHSDLPERLQLSSGYPNIYGRLHSDKPADTITGNFGCVSAPGRFIHPKEDRALSVREGARLQSFPDTYKFFGPQNLQYKQVGNAVPPLLSRAIAESLNNSS